MKRRDFLQNTGFLTCGCALGAIAHNLAQIKERRNVIKSGVINQEDITKVMQKSKYFGWLKHIQFAITYHCNLNCAYCNNMSPIAPIYHLPLDVFEKDIIQMAKITNKKIQNIGLLGGEPLLNKKIEEYIKIAHRNFEDSKITITTNGLLLNEMPDSFWKCCAENNTNIKYTIYPLSKNYPTLLRAYEQAKKYHVELLIKNSAYHFRLMNLDTKNLNNKEETHKNCGDRSCILIDHGRMYPCPCVQTVDMFFNKYFKDKQIAIDENDYCDIYKLKNAKDIHDFVNKAKDMCKYCNFATSDGEDRVWAYSKKDASEWRRA